MDWTERSKVWNSVVCYFSIQYVTWNDNIQRDNNTHGYTIGVKSSKNNKISINEFFNLNIFQHFVISLTEKIIPSDMPQQSK